MNSKKEIDGGSATLIPASQNKAIRLAIVKLNGSYPKEGFYAVNNKKTEAVLVISGNISVIKEGKLFTLKKNDFIYFEPGEKYEIKGNAEIFVAISPGDAPTTDLVKKDL